jgi:hypothetical protein
MLLVAVDDGLFAAAAGWVEWPVVEGPQRASADVHAANAKLVPQLQTSSYSGDQGFKFRI